MIRKNVALLIGVLMLTSCSAGELTRERELIYDPVSRGSVLSKVVMAVENGESPVARTLAVLAFGGPISAIEDVSSREDIGKSSVYKYTLDIGSDANVEVVSLSIVEIGDYVEVIDINNPDYYLLKKLKQQVSSEGILKCVENLTGCHKDAEQGQANSQYSLGVMYEKGQGVIQDYIIAHMWLNIASSNASKQAPKKRKEIEVKMSANQISEAQKLAREWVAKHQD